MKFNWKVVLLFVLILAFIVPVYSKAVETGKEVPKSPELLDDKSSTLKNVNTPKKFEG